MQGLEAGADDFLTKPVDDIALVTRVKNLARLKLLSDELHARRPRASSASTVAASRRRGRAPTSPAA